MSTIRENIKEWFSTIIGVVLILVLAVNFFTGWPQELTVMQQIGGLAIGGMFLFGNPKTFFPRLIKMFTQNLNK